MEGIIIWGVIWLISIPLIWVLSVVGIGITGGLIGDRVDSYGGGEAGASIGGFIGWIVGAIWAVIALIQVIIHVVDLVQFIIAAS